MENDGLKGFIEAVSGDDHLAIEENLGSGFVKLKTAEAERRQAKHDIRHVEDVVIEVLRNARDAHAKNIYISTSTKSNVRYITVIDDGDGIPVELQDRIFDARVTSKLDSMVMDNWGVHGRGMALYSIRSNVDDIRIVDSAPSLGSSFSITIDLDALPERADQSSLPVLTIDEDGACKVASGPHNINRCVAEFALDSEGSLNVYLGSPSDIAATLVDNAAASLSDAQILFNEDIAALPIASRPGLAADAQDLACNLRLLGIEMSERTAHRVISGQIEPLEPFVRALKEEQRKRTADARPVDLLKDRRGLKIAEEDLEDFTAALEHAFEELMKRYYMKSTEKPAVRVGKDAINVRFSFNKEL